MSAARKLSVDGVGQCPATDPGPEPTPPTDATPAPPTSEWHCIVCLDDEGAVVLDTALGAGLVAESDLPSALECLVDADGAPINEAALADALRVPSGQPTTLRWRQAGEEWTVRRIDREDLATALGFIQSPAPATAKPGKSHH